MPPKAPFRVGQKQVYLPNFTITLLRTPFLPPTFAKFIVPLNINKLDLRDYLYHVYGITALNVRSYVQQQKVQQDKSGAKRPAPRRWHRPRAKKMMMVEMDKPFVWPEVPEDFSLWDKETHDAAEEYQEKEQEQYSPDASQKPPSERQSIAEQAKLLLEGKERWRPTWEDVGEEVEIERDIQIDRNTLGR